LNIIERYNISLDTYDEFQIKLTVPVYGCLAILTSDSKLLIGGGYNSQRGSVENVYTIDLSNGVISNMKPLSKPAWTVLPPYLNNDEIILFSTGEETDILPQIVKYNIDLPF
jgi:hypothetical protein